MNTFILNKKLVLILVMLIIAYIIQYFSYYNDEIQGEKELNSRFEEFFSTNPELLENGGVSELVHIYGSEILDPYITGEILGKYVSKEEDFESPNLNIESENLENGFKKIKLFDHQNGFLIEEYIINNNKLNGIKKTWDDNGNIIEESNYKDGLLHGVQKIFYENGNIRTEKYYDNGKYSGSSKAWYMNGQKALESTYKNNQIINAKSYYSDGLLRLEEELSEESGILTTKAYYKDQNLSHIFNSIDNMKTGTLLQFSPLGIKVAEVEYENNLNNGWCKLWNEKGELITEIFYKNGRVDDSKRILGRSCEVDLWEFGFR